MSASAQARARTSPCPPVGGGQGLVRGRRAAEADGGPRQEWDNRIRVFSSDFWLVRHLSGGESLACAPPVKRLACAPKVERSEPYGQPAVQMESTRTAGRHGRVTRKDA